MSASMKQYRPGSLNSWSGRLEPTVITASGHRRSQPDHTDHSHRSPMCFVLNGQTSMALPGLLWGTRVVKAVCGPAVAWVPPTTVVSALPSALLATRLLRLTVRVRTGRHSTARADEFTGQLPNPSWGHGKLYFKFLRAGESRYSGALSLISENPVRFQLFSAFEH